MGCRLDTPLTVVRNTSKATWIPPRPPFWPEASVVFPTRGTALQSWSGQTWLWIPRSLCLSARWNCCTSKIYSEISGSVIWSPGRVPLARLRFAASPPNLPRRVAPLTGPTPGGVSPSSVLFSAHHPPPPSPSPRDAPRSLPSAPCSSSDLRTHSLDLLSCPLLQV